jgi:hypothetical protein
MLHDDITSKGAGHSMVDSSELWKTGRISMDRAKNDIGDELGWIDDDDAIALC